MKALHVPIDKIHIINWFKNCWLIGEKTSKILVN